MAEITVVCDLFDWLPRWGEFNVRFYDKKRTFCVEVDYEVGEAHEANKPIRTKLIRFTRPVAVLRCSWPLPQELQGLGHTGLADRGQIVDLGSTDLRAQCLFNFRRSHEGFWGELRHYYVYFDDMKITFQVVADSVEVTDIDPPTDV